MRTSPPLGSGHPPRGALRRLGMVLATVVATGCAGDGGRIVAPPVEEPGTNPFRGASMWVDPASPARRTADAWQSTRAADAAQMEKIAQQPHARWLGHWNADIRSDVAAATATMAAAGTLPVFVAYNLPQEGCGGISAPFTTTPEEYRAWVAALAEGIGMREAVVILEPDALGGLDCLSPAGQQRRLELLRYAVQALRAHGTVSVYLDAGNPRWQPASVMAGRLTSAGVAMAQGFSLNVANFLTTAENVTYGVALSALVGGKHFVIDTGRNGAGSNGEWCNPAGRALGSRPTTTTGHPLADAYLWIKAPGESDGPCNGAGAPGDWMPEYALGLAQRAAW